MNDSLKRDIKNAIYTLDSLTSEIEDLESEISNFRQKILDLEYTIDTISGRNLELVDETDRLKIELLEAKAVITKQESEFLTKMYNSNNDRDMAKKIIDNIE